MFTLGVIGTPLGDRPAARLLLAMIDALPPVKRVAALGDDAALFAAVLGDMYDAELLLLATPADAGGLPARLRALLDYCAEAAARGELRGKVAALAASGDLGDAQRALAALHSFCATAGISVANALAYPLIIDQAARDQARAAAEQAYVLAESRLPTPSLARRTHASKAKP